MSVVTKKYIGYNKLLHYVVIALRVACHYLREVITLKLSLRDYALYMYRLILLLQAVFPNKLIKINGLYRFQLYLPSFPSKPFYHALEKFRPTNCDPAPITVVFSMTKACTYKCPHCYQHRDVGRELEIEKLVETAKEMVNRGVAFFDIEGGEPMIKFDRMLTLLSAFDERAEVWMNTTGHLVTMEKALELKKNGLYGVMVSLHSADRERYEEFVGVPGAFDVAIHAIKIFQDVGIVVAINYCPMKEDVKNGNVVKLLELAKSLDVSMVQVIHAKNAGAWLYDQEHIYTDEDMIKDLKKLHREFNEIGDATTYPSILFQVFEESHEAFGCTAGGVDRFYLNHEGEVQPCEFLNVSFGNVRDDTFSTILTRMRGYFQKPGENWLCCTESKSIGDIISEKKLEKTPVPWDYTKELMGKWKVGSETKLYRKLGLYDRKK